MPPSDDSYQRKKESERARNAERSRAGRDIGQIPPPADPARRTKGEGSLLDFLKTYFPARFPLEFSPDHLALIAALQTIATDGGLEAFGMPRGSGKTTLCECAALWAVLTGRRKYVALIGASEDAAGQMLASIKGELEDNDLLAADFPEVCLPIRALEGIANRCKGQTCAGQRTRITWSDKTAILPTIAGSMASGSLLCPRGITGRLRGMKHKLVSGETIRPDLAIVDDPQTDESARSPAQCEKRLRIVCGAILGLAGPGQKIAACMPCTVIEKGDLADRVLNRDLHPEWHGRLTKLAYAFPMATTLWDQYAELRRASFRAGRHGEEGTEFYRAHRQQMDVGARVAWAERYNADELSAVQHVMNLRIDNPRSFAAEYQNEPVDDTPPDQRLPTVAEVAARYNGLAAGQWPIQTTVLTAFIDVQDRALYWLVAAWTPYLGGDVIAYGTWPEQPRRHFTYRDLRVSLKDKFPQATLAGQIRGGLEALTDELLTRDWHSPAGQPLRIRRCLVDSGDNSRTIYQFCRESPHRAVILPSKGVGITADRAPITEWKTAPGAQIGLHWHVGTAVNQRSVRLVTFDANSWKKLTDDGLAAAIGDPQAIRLFGSARTADHQMFAEHAVGAETRQKTEGRGRTVFVYRLKPAKPDNHLKDCLVGAAVAASLEGCSPDRGPGQTAKPKPKPSPSRPLSRVSYL